MTKAKNISNPQEISEIELLIQEALKSWKYTIHPLRNHHISQVNKEYIYKLMTYFKSTDFNQGRMEFFTLDLSGKLLVCGLRKLIWDSDFFGFPIGKLEILVHPFDLEVSRDAIKAVTDILVQAISLAKKYGLKHIIASADSADVVSINALESIGFLLKDTMFYHLFDLKQTKLDLQAKRQTRLANDNDFEALAEITGNAFGSRASIANRFNADPQYPPAKTVEMYKVWIKKSLSGESADRVFMIDYQGKPAGYLTAIMPKTDQHELGIAFGDQGVGCVDPSAKGQGCFQALHKEVLSWFQQHNIDFALTRTAINTIGVNKTCFKHGSLVVCSPHTFHLDLNAH